MARLSSDAIELVSFMAQNLEVNIICTGVEDVYCKEFRGLRI